MEMLATVTSAAQTAAAQFYARQSRDLASVWVIPETSFVSGLVSEGRLQVAGVYVDLFLKEPTFPLRQPKRFLEALLEAVITPLENRNADEERRVRLTQACVALVKARGELGEHIVALGYVGRLVQLIAESSSILDATLAMHVAVR
jgi:hypothetical protein